MANVNFNEEAVTAFKGQYKVMMDAVTQLKDDATAAQNGLAAVWTGQAADEHAKSWAGVATDIEGLITSMQDAMTKLESAIAQFNESEGDALGRSGN